MLEERVVWPWLSWDVQDTGILLNIYTLNSVRTKNWWYGSIAKHFKIYWSRRAFFIARYIKRNLSKKIFFHKIKKLSHSLFKCGNNINQLGSIWPYAAVPRNIYIYIVCPIQKSSVAKICVNQEFYQNRLLGATMCMLTI